MQVLLSGTGSFVTDGVDHGPVSYQLAIRYNHGRHTISADGTFSAAYTTVARAFSARQPTCLQLADGRRIDVAINATGGHGRFVVCQPRALDEALSLGRAQR
jgi:hypothetical protein